MRTVLVIEDELQTRNMFLTCLEFEGFKAIGAENGTVGVKLAGAYQPDLIVCDIMMPDTDGYSVLSEVRSRSSIAATPFIFLTAKVTMPELRKGMELGADDYLTKPCTVEQFLAAIETRLQRHDHLRHCYGHPAEVGRSPQSSPPPLVQLTGQRPRTTAPVRPEKNQNQGSTKFAAARSEASPSSIFPNCPKLTKVFNYIETHYHQSINLNDVAQVAGYSPAYLTNLTQNYTGRTIKQWIIERRMVQARKLLANTNKSIKQIAEDAGYTDGGYFVRQFRQIHGVPPQVWRHAQDAQAIEKKSHGLQKLIQ